MEDNDMKTCKTFGSIIELFVFLLIAALLCCLAPAPAAAADLDYNGVTDYTGFSVHEFVLTMDSGGATAQEWSKGLKGIVIAVDTDPGTTAPTDNYDMTIKDSYGVDIMGGALANRDTANSERAWPLFNDGTDKHVVHAPVAGALTFGVDAASNLVGNATVTIRVYTIGEKKGTLSW